MLSTSGTSHQAAPNSGKHCIANFAPKPYNATINVPLKISYALTPIPKSSQYHPNTMPNPILKDISHQHMEGVQFLVLDEPLQSSTSTSISGWPMVGQGFHQMSSRDPFLLWPFHRGTAVGQCTERSFGNLKAHGVLNGDQRCSEWCSEWRSEWWWSSYTMLYLALMLYGEWWWVSRQVQCLDMFCSNTWKTCNAMESRAKCKDGITLELHLRKLLAVTGGTLACTHMSGKWIDSKRIQFWFLALVPTDRFQLQYVEVVCFSTLARILNWVVLT